MEKPNIVTSVLEGLVLCQSLVIVLARYFITSEVLSAGKKSDLS